MCQKWSRLIYSIFVKNFIFVFLIIFCKRITEVCKFCTKVDTFLLLYKTLVLPENAPHPRSLSIKKYLQRSVFHSELFNTVYVFVRDTYLETIIFTQKPFFVWNTVCLCSFVLEKYGVVIIFVPFPYSFSIYSFFSRSCLVFCNYMSVIVLQLYRCTRILMSKPMRSAWKCFCKQIFKN